MEIRYRGPCEDRYSVYSHGHGGMVFYLLNGLNRALMEKVDAENWKPFEGLTYS